MNKQGIVLKPARQLNSSRVRRFVLKDKKTRVTQITTFCPDIIGPGPTHLYLIEKDGLVLLDTGLPTYLAKHYFYYFRNQPIPPEVEALPDDYSQQELLEGLKLAGRHIKDIDLLVISHGHMDHFLLGRWIIDQADCPVTAHILDTSGICNPWGVLQDIYYRRKQTFSMGMPQPDNRFSLDAFLSSINEDPGEYTLPIKSPLGGDGPLKINGSVIDGIDVTHLPGHSPGGIGLIVGDKEREKILLCGDVLLNPITPHPDDLLTYLRTLDKLKHFDDVQLVLPAHGKVIGDLKKRIAFLERFHYNRLKTTYRICKTPASIWSISTKPGYFTVFVHPDKFNPLAGTEAMLHVELLQMVDGLNRTAIEKGVHLFENSGEPFDDVYQRIINLVKDHRIHPVVRY